jgi:hypothetical protein
MGPRRDLIIKRLTSEGESVLEFFRDLGEADWERRVYAEGSRWTVRQVLCHFVSAEDGFLRLARNILDGGAGAPEGMDIDAFNEREVGGMADRTTVDLLPEFERLRAETVELVHGMSEADLSREGRHPFFGRSSLEKLLKLVYRHNMIHLRDIRRTLKEAENG